jgi:CheY-like chemotaxis protein/HPt (histidine-containing phosphotransfer) domain-containing protein
MKRSQSISSDGARKTVLVVEDNKTNQNVIIQQLNLLGLECDIADNGKEGLEKWQSGSYAMILTDCRMPVMDGLEMSRKIRELEKQIHVPIVALTASLLEDESYKCIAAGMDEHVSKPVDLNALRKILHRWLNADAVSCGGNELPCGREDKPERRVEEQICDHPIDKKILDETVGTDFEIQRYIINTFVDTAPEIITDMQLAGQRRAFQEISDLAHKLKSAARTIGASAMCRTSENMELAARREDFDAVKDLLLEVKRQSECIQSYFCEHWGLLQSRAGT